MRTIVEMQPLGIGVHPEAEPDSPNYEIELETPFECQQFLGILGEHYRSAAESDELTIERLAAIDDHLLQCDPADKDSHRSFFISSDEANILAFLLKQRAVEKGVRRLCVALEASRQLGAQYRNIAPLLKNPATKKAYEGLTITQIEPEVGKVALKLEQPGR
jgi:hypothetical protein